MLEHDKKLDKMLSFVEKMTRHGLNGVQHFADGGVLGGINNVLGLTNKNQAANANIQNPVSQGQINESYSGVQGALGQQQAQATLLNQQTNQGAATQTQLNGMLLNRAQGNGPSPAQNQLNQETGHNIQQQAALAAGQRGASANAGLIARQNAQQGAATQQQAVGQAATLGAQEQIAAQQQLQQLAGTQVAQGTGAVTSLSQAEQNEQAQLLNAQSAYNNAQAGIQSNMNNVNASTALANQQQRANTLSSIFSGASAASTGMAAAHGGVVKKYAAGGFTAQWGGAPVNVSAPNIEASNLTAQKEGSFLKKTDKPKGKEAPATQGNLAGGPADTGAPAMDMSNPTMGAAAGPTMLLSSDGGNVKAKSTKEKAVKKDNSYDNDKIPALLSEGEIVLPRSVTMHPMAPEKAAEFVRRTLAKKGLRK